MEFTLREEKFIQYYATKKELSHVEKVKLAFGLRMVTREMKKVVVIYGIALWMGLLWEMLIVQIGFLFVRQVAYGLHCTSSKVCLVVSSILFPSIAWIVITLTVTPLALWGCYLLTLAILLGVGPTSSQKTKVRSKKHYTFLYKKLVVRLCAGSIGLLFLPTQVGALIVAGIMMSTTLVVLAKIQHKGE
ncbi:accessory gene regulator B family protein [Sporosarcina aquimarina]|uniref:Accessory gene regulator B family protein n=1 Tax=Sporosarcina aquimarina TaxID=114975 RepID=A0ABU4FXP8_9BACL|nr:accessory gene regulator B family protein [Sporosarcina aquimarina]MDW0108902.1 accessory gene regulator B family protein [Sporosarcina aquimarina]